MIAETAGLIEEAEIVIPELEEINPYMAALLSGFRVALLASEASRARMESAIRWALGYDEGEPEFMPRQEGEGPYWWRAELRRRAALSLGGGDGEG